MAENNLKHTITEAINNLVTKDEIELLIPIDEVVNFICKKIEVSKTTETDISKHKEVGCYSYNKSEVFKQIEEESRKRHDEDFKKLSHQMHITEDKFKKFTDSMSEELIKFGRQYRNIKFQQNYGGIYDNYFYVTYQNAPADTITKALDNLGYKHDPVLFDEVTNMMAFGVELP